MKPEKPAVPSPIEVESVTPPNVEQAKSEPAHHRARREMACCGVTPPPADAAREGEMGSFAMLVCRRWRFCREGDNRSSNNRGAECRGARRARL